VGAKTLKTGNTRPSRSLTSPKQLALRERRAQALDLRLKGQSFAQIGQALGISVASAHNDLAHAIEGMIPREKAEQQLRLDLARLDQLYGVAHRKGLEGDMQAQQAALRIIDTRAKLLGLYKQPAMSSAIDERPREMIVNFVWPTRKTEDDYPLHYIEDSVPAIPYKPKK